MDTGRLLRQGAVDGKYNVRWYDIYTNTALLAVLHFLVDGLCACGLVLMAGMRDAGETLVMFVLYNVVAFGSQPAAGWFTDRTFPRMLPLPAALLSLFFGVLSCLFAVSFHEGSFPFLCAFFLGAGNSLFHVYGGKYVTAAWNNDIRPLGVFVSAGALGLASGLCFSSVWLLLGIMLAVVLLAGFHLRCCRVHVSPHLPVGARPSAVQGKSAVPVFFLLCLLSVVAGRSFLGRAIPPAGAGSPALLLLVSAVAMAGKASGGFLSMRFGVNPTLVGSLMLACCAFLLCPCHAALIPVTVFLVNISMPCTLYLANKVMPGREGLAFGLLAAALLPGYWLGGVCADNPSALYLLTPLLATILIEGIMLVYMREKAWRVLVACVVMNVLTNVPLNIIVSSSGVSWPGVIGLESLVVIMEYFIYRGVRLDRRTALTYSVVCNATSFLAGLIFQIIFL